MKLIETSVTQTNVRMRYQDTRDPSMPDNWIELQVPLSMLKLPSNTPLGDPESHFLATVREVALRYVRDVFDAEIVRLEARRNRGRG